VARFSSRWACGRCAAMIRRCGAAALLASDSEQKALRDGLLTSLANPKLAVFFVALFPQFVPPHGAVFPTALGMAAVIVVVDLVWYSILACVVSRAKRALVDGPWQRRIDRPTGAVLIGLGVRLALERRWTRGSGQLVEPDPYQPFQAAELPLARESSCETTLLGRLVRARSGWESWGRV
jgi:hypothetical protein